MILTMAAALLLSLQASPLDDFYKFKAGTTWTYKHVQNGEERKIVGTVTGEEEGKVRVEWKETEKDGTPRKTSILTWSVADGLLTVEAKEVGEDAALSFSVLKGDARKDDTWASPGGEFTHQGKADVTVPAATYKDAVLTRFKAGEGDTEILADFYLAPQVGLVKVEVKGKNGHLDVFELAEFKDAKK